MNLIETSIHSLSAELERQKVSLHTTQEATSASQSDLATCRGMCREHHIAISNLFTHLSHAEAKAAALKQETSQLVDRLNAMAHGINQFETRIAGAQYQLKEQVNFHAVQQATRMDNFQNSIVGPLFSAFQHLLVGDSPSQAHPGVQEALARRGCRQLSAGPVQDESVSATSSGPTPGVAAAVITTMARSMSQDSNAPLAKTSKSYCQPASGELDSSQNNHLPLSSNIANGSSSVVGASELNDPQSSSSIFRTSLDPPPTRLQPQVLPLPLDESLQHQELATESEPLQATPPSSLSHPSASPLVTNTNPQPPEEGPKKACGSDSATSDLHRTTGGHDQASNGGPDRASIPLKRKRTPSIEFVRTQFASELPKQGQPSLAGQVPAASAETAGTRLAAGALATASDIGPFLRPLQQPSAAVPPHPLRTTVNSIAEQATLVSGSANAGEVVSGGEAGLGPQSCEASEAPKPLVATVPASRQSQNEAGSLQPVLLTQVIRSCTVTSMAPADSPQQALEQTLPRPTDTVSPVSTPTERTESLNRPEANAINAKADPRLVGKLEDRLQKGAAESVRSHSVNDKSGVLEAQLGAQPQWQQATRPSAPLTASERASSATERDVHAEAHLSTHTRVDTQQQATVTVGKEASALVSSAGPSVRQTSSLKVLPHSPTSIAKPLPERTSFVAKAPMKSGETGQADSSSVSAGSPREGHAERPSEPLAVVRQAKKHASLPEKPAVACRASSEKPSWIQYLVDLSNRSRDPDLHDPYYIWAYLGRRFSVPLVITQDTLVQVSLVSATLANTLVDRKLATVVPAGENEWLEVDLEWIYDAGRRMRSSDRASRSFSAERCRFLVIPKEYMRNGIVLAGDELLRLELEVDATREIVSRAYLAVHGRIELGINLMGLPKHVLRTNPQRPFDRMCRIAEHAMSRKDVSGGERRARTLLEDDRRTREETKWWRDSEMLYHSSRSRECVHRSPEPKLSKRISDRLDSPPSARPSEAPPPKRQRLALATAALDTGSPLSELTGEEEDELLNGGEQGQIAPQTYHDLTPQEQDECLRRTRRLLNQQEQRRKQGGAVEPASTGLSLLGSSSRATAQG